MRVTGLTLFPMLQAHELLKENHIHTKTELKSLREQVQVSAIVIKSICSEITEQK